MKNTEVRQDRYIQYVRYANSRLRLKTTGAQRRDMVRLDSVKRPLYKNSEVEFRRFTSTIETERRNRIGGSQD